MFSQKSPRLFLPCSKAKRDVEGLRDYGCHSIVRVYRANPDGTKGEFLREEDATYPDIIFNRLPGKGVKV